LSQERGTDFRYRGESWFCAGSSSCLSERGVSEREVGLWGEGGERVHPETTVAEEDRERAGACGIQTVVE